MAPRVMIPNKMQYAIEKLSFGHSFFKLGGDVLQQLLTPNTLTSNTRTTLSLKSAEAEKRVYSTDTEDNFCCGGPHSGR
eukprot:3696910-Amphidinium_carterae.1